MTPDQLREAPLADQIAWWRARQRYPIFLNAGLVNPADYSRAQSLIHEGPETWKKEWKFLDEVNYHRRTDVEREQILGQLPEAMAQELAQPWRRHFYWSPKEPAAWVLGMSCSMLGSFFRLMEPGIEEAVVRMASDDNANKPSRRCPWRRELLLLLFTPEERWEILQRATKTNQIAWLRHRALRWLCPMVEQDEVLDTWLRGFENEGDPLVKFWAAFRFGTKGWFPYSPPPPPPPWMVHAVSFGFRNSTLLDDYSQEEEHQRAIAVCALDHLGLDTLKETAARLEIELPHDAYVWWYLLGFIRVWKPTLLESMRDHWKAVLPQASHEALRRFLALLEDTQKASDLLDYTQHPDAPQPSDSDPPALRFPLNPGAFALRHELHEPSGRRKFLKRLLTELHRQDVDFRPDRKRLDRVWELLKEHVPAQEEDFRTLNAAIPFAIADHLLNDPNPPTLPGYDFSRRTMSD